MEVQTGPKYRAASLSKNVERGMIVIYGVCKNEKCIFLHGNDDGAKTEWLMQNFANLQILNCSQGVFT